MMELRPSVILVLSLYVVFGTLLLNGQEHPEDFEPVLIPVYDSGQGAHGSEWTTILRIYNDAETEARFGRTPVFAVPCSLGTACLGHLPPKMAIGFGYVPNSPTGAVLYEPKSHRGAIDYQLRIRDLSRQLDTWGTELPVVREAEFYTEPVSLLDFPTGERFRGSLRVYSLSEPVPSVRVRIFSQPEPTIDEPMPSFEMLAETTLVLSRRNAPNDVTGFRFFPSFAAVHDLAGEFPAIREHEQVRVELTSLTAGVSIWGFISVTNNETQHVTTLTPQ